MFFKKNKPEKNIDSSKEEVSPSRKWLRWFSHLGMDPIHLLVGHDLIAIADPKQNGLLPSEIDKLRGKMTEDVGLIFPNVRIMDYTCIEKNEYLISIRGVSVCKNHLENTDQDTPELNDKIIKDLRKSVILHADKLIDHTYVRRLLELLRTQEADVELVAELVPDQLSISSIQRILTNLVTEEVCIRDVLYLFDRLLDFSQYEQKPDLLSEKIRHALRLAISSQHSEKENKPLSEVWEKRLSEKLIEANYGYALDLDSETKFELISEIRTLSAPVLVCSSKIRLPLARVLLDAGFEITVLASDEIVPVIACPRHFVIPDSR